MTNERGPAVPGGGLIDLVRLVGLAHVDLRGEVTELADPEWLGIEDPPRVREQRRERIASGEHRVKDLGARGGDPARAGGPGMFRIP